MREDVPLPITADAVIPTFKKIGELLGGYIGGASGLEVLREGLRPRHRAAAVG